MSCERIVLDRIARDHAMDVAGLLDVAAPDHATQAFAALAPSTAAAVALRMNPAASAGALFGLEPAAAAAILADCAPALAARILTYWDAPHRAAVLDLLPAVNAGALERLVAQKADTAGALMDPLAPSVMEDVSAASAQQGVRAAKQALYYLYVTNREQRLVGVLTLTELLHAEPHAILRELMKREPEAVLATATLTSLASHPGWQRYHAMPVTDREGRYLGALRYETVREVEHKLGQAVQRSPAAETASALADFYTVSLLGLARALVPSGAEGENKEPRD